MKDLNRKQISEFASAFLDGSDVHSFVNLYAKEKSKKQKISLIDRLINSKTTKLNWIKRGELTAVPDPKIFVFDARGRGKSETFDNGRWVKKLNCHRMMWCEDVDERFKFVIESQDDFALLTIAEVNPNLQGQGLFSELVAAIRLVCFDHYNYKGVKGRAAIPQTTLFSQEDPARADFSTKAGDDWRSEFLQTEKSDETAKHTTKLFDVWCRRRLVYPSVALSEMAGDDEFVMLSEKIARKLDNETMFGLEESYPKASNQLFVNTV